MARRQGNQLDTPTGEQRISHDQKRGCPLLYHRRKRRVDLAVVARVKHCDLLPDGGHSSLHIPYGRISDRILWIGQDDYIDISRDQLPQESEPLWPQLLGKVAHTGRITSGPIETIDETELDRVGANAEYNRNCFRCSLGGQR